MSIRYSIFLCFYKKNFPFSFLEGLSLFVACLCHDLDHRGTTSSFQVTSVSASFILLINLFFYKIFPHVN